MTETTDEPISPTVKKILDAYLEVLKGDNDVDDVSAERLVDLLREGKVPKPADIEAALFPVGNDGTAE